MSYRALKIAAAALSAGAMLVPAVADAQYYPAPQGYYDRGGYQGAYDRGYDGRDYDRYAQYDRRDDRRDARARRRADYRDDRGDRGRRCDRGTGGTLLGAIAGGLLGNVVAGRGDRGTGTIFGAGVGALAGRSIDRDC